MVSYGECKKSTAAETKKKMMDKIIKHIKNNVRFENKTDDDLYQECKIAGFMMYEFLCDYVEENNK